MTSFTRIATLLLALPLAAAAQGSHEAALKNLKFRNIGPAVMGGRVDDFAVVESDPRIVYVATAAGGIFKTVNAGITWEPIFDDQPNSSIGDITLAPSTPAILYVGTGEANNRQSSSWPLGDLWGPNPDRGVFQSSDGGATSTKSLFIDDDTGISDLAIDPESPNIVYAAAYVRRRTVFGYNGGGPKSGIYRSTDSGKTWEKLSKGLPATGDVGRCAIDIYRRNSNIVYVLIEHMTQGGIYRSDDKGATWRRQSDTNPRPSYYSQVRVDPNNENKVWVLGAPLYMSEDGGRTFTQERGRGIHSDFHAFWIDPANGDHIFTGNDGGVTVTHDSGRTWDFLNNFAIGQFYEVAYDFQKPYHVCGGLQDNYSWCGPSANVQTTGISNEEWININGGDGFHARIDPTDHNIIYSESQDGNLNRRDLRTSEQKSIRPQEESDTAPRYRFQWNSPLIISPHDPKTIYYGGNHLFKSRDRGDTWEILGEDLTTKQVRDQQQILGKTWHNVVSHIPGVKGAMKDAYVSRIEASYKDEGVAYVTFDNHRSADFSVHIYMTINYGDSWVRISNGIPPEAGAVHAIREDPANSNLLFAGAEFGLFMSFNRGQTWEKMKNGLPTVPVFDLQIHPLHLDHGQHQRS